MNELTMALLAALGGGFGVKVLDIIIARVQFGQTTEADTRKVMRADIDRLAARVDALQTALDQRTREYYDLRTENVQLQATNSNLQDDLTALKEENTTMKGRIADLERQVEKLSGKQGKGVIG